MRDEQTTVGVGGPGAGARLPTAAPPPRPEVSTPRPPAGKASAGGGGQRPTTAAETAVARGALGDTVAQFIVDPTSYEVRVRLIDPQTRTVVREIPPGDLISLVRGSGTYQGILVDRSV
ncbi:MAG: flagellar protein FlaG [Chloroflexi bacterium]|nr:flagellar protein FlaG [Chloroflexota bacterium]MBI4506770.1 flagellar protein FlaG [Chloroflexota bacterium]